MGRRLDTVSFLSDYGLADEFVGVVHSVIRSISPHVTVIDVSHEVPSHDVRAGSLTLVRAVQYLAPGVVLAVVDPGVGTARRAVAVQAGTEVEGTEFEGTEIGGGGVFFVGPDNGLLAASVAMVGGASRAVELTNSAYQLPAPGPTFSGRDIFGPAAAHLCNGLDLTELGPEIDVHTLTPGLVPLSRREGERLLAEVLWIDHYGNIQLNVSPEDIAQFGDRITIRCADQVRTAVRADTFDDVGPGQLGVLVDSYGLVALTVNRASAADELGVKPGDAVTLHAPEG